MLSNAPAMSAAKLFFTRNMVTWRGHTHTHTLVTCAPNNLPKVAKVPAGSITKVHRSNQKMQSLRE